MYRDLLQELLAPTLRDLRRNPDAIENTYLNNPFCEFFVSSQWLYPMAMRTTSKMTMVLMAI